MIVALGLLARQLGHSTIGPGILFLTSILGTLAVTYIIPRFQLLWVEAIQSRISFTASMLASMRTIKLLGLSNVTKTLCQNLRLSELRHAAKYRWLLLARVLFQNFTPMFGPLVLMGILILKADASDKVLNIGTAYSVLTVLQLVEGPLQILSYSLPQFVSSLSCLERIQQYLMSQSRQDDRMLLSGQSQPEVAEPGSEFPAQDGIEMRNLIKIEQNRHEPSEVLVLRDCSFGWKFNQPTVRDLNFSIRRGETTMIVGPVGAGKSTVLKGILGETPCTLGFVYVDEVSFAFADQEAWIQNLTLREAIIGPDVVLSDPGWFHEVIDACGLRIDIEHLDLGDRTILGSRGVSLSGGQKQR